MRHSANMERLYEEMERIEKENAEKAFKKYCGIVKLYFFLIFFFIYYYSIFIEKNNKKNINKEKKMLVINYKKNNIDQKNQIEKMKKKENK